MFRNPSRRISSIPHTVVPLPVEQFREVVLRAPCRSGRVEVEAHRGLDAAEELQPMFVLVLSMRTRQTFVLGFGPSLLPLPHLYIFSCGQSASPVSERG
jgi:hypothetical protein